MGEEKWSIKKRQIKKRDVFGMDFGRRTQR